MPVRPTLRLSTVAALTVAIVAVSSAAPLIVDAAVAGLAIVFWRNAFAALVLVPVTAVTRPAELRGLDRRTSGQCVLAGLALAAHFGTWIPSITLTSIAASTALAATQPIWQGLIAVACGHRLARRVWLGMVLAVGGVVLATGFDLATSARAVTGDLLALAGGLFGAIYVALGESARARVSTRAFTSICYAVCALVVLAVCLSAGVPLGDYPAHTWLILLALALGPQLLGHSMFNYALRWVGATTVSVLVLLEVPGAALLGWVWLGQAPRPGQLPGLALLLAGALLTTVGYRSRPVPVTSPTESFSTPARCGYGTGE